MSSINSYALKNFYKGTFLGYCSEKYDEESNFEAYIDIKDLILSNGSKDILSESINDSNIVNRTDLNLEKTIKSINSIKCKPLFINKFLPYLNEGDTVFVFFINNDPKKIFYVPISNDLSSMDIFKIRIGDNQITLDKNEIVLERMKENEDDISITISNKGIELVGNIFANGENVTRLLNPNLR